MNAISIVVLLVLLSKESGLADAATHPKQELIEVSPVKCSNETGNDLSEAQRGHIIYMVNKFRSIINNSKRRRKRAVSKYRKVKYSCVFEAEAKFECDADLSPGNFKSNEYTWRRAEKTEQMTDPFNNSMRNAYNEKDTFHMTLSTDVTEIGCFDKSCNGYEYIACKTGYAIVPAVDTPLYTPNSRCKVDADCTVPGYTQCDTALGLCDWDPPDKKVVSPTVCLSLSSPRIPLFEEKCDGVYKTVRRCFWHYSAKSNAERLFIANYVTEFRAMVNNNCTLGLGVPKPASNYRKVKYSCALENDSKFECDSNLKPKSFISETKTWRSKNIKVNNKIYRQSAFYFGAPIARQLLINPDTATVENVNDKAVFIKLFMSEDVTEIGCYVKVCGDYEHIACTTNHDHTIPNSAPLYTPGQRCYVDADCTLPGYHTCDANVGLCDYKSHFTRRMDYDDCADRRYVYIERVAEACKARGYDTGSEISNLEREVYVDVVNHFRARINNKCYHGLGNVKPITNYRKVKYSCTLEERAKFDCPKDDNAQFKSDRFTLRGFTKVENLLRRAFFVARSPYNQYMMIDPDNQRMWPIERTRNFMRFVMSPDVTEFGCFIKVCGEYEYMACKTGHVVLAPKEIPLYEPGKRCLADADCTLPGYTQCDTALGLCDWDPPDKKVVSPMVCLSSSSLPIPLFEEKCDGVYKTGSAKSNAERLFIANYVTEFRAMVNNNCTLGLGVPKPASNYRKVKYSCTLETKSMFECDSTVTTETFNSNNKTWRCWHHKTNDIDQRLIVFYFGAPIARQLLINPDTATVENDSDEAVFIKLFMSEDVTEIGCYVQVCGDYEYIACTTNHDHTIPNSAPLYTPGQRCYVDADCTLPGYHTCDANVGLCDFNNHLQIENEALAHKCDEIHSVFIQQEMERCSLGYNTGSNISNIERELIVYTVNYFRKLINNNCDFGKSIVKHVTNYRKVKYSCALEEDAKFECSDVNSDNFKSDQYTLRLYRTNQGFFRSAVFIDFSPWNELMEIDPDNQTIGATGNNMDYAHIMLSPDVTEIGCFVKARVDVGPG